MILKNILITLTMVLLVQLTFAQTRLAKNSLQKAKQINNSGYILSVDQDVIKWRDTVYYYASKLRGCRYALVPVTLTNLTADTLKYIDMSCSTLDIFTTDTRDANIIKNQPCYKNTPIMFKLASYASVTFELPICFFSGDVGVKHILAAKEFKIGMGIFKYAGKKYISEDYPHILTKSSENIIWSKVVTVQ